MLCSLRLLRLRRIDRRRVSTATSYVRFLFAVEAPSGPSVAATHVALVPAPADGFSARLDDGAPIEVYEGAAEELVSITAAPPAAREPTPVSTPARMLLVATPQQCDAHVRCGRGGASVRAKLEGNCDIASRDEGDNDKGRDGDSDGGGGGGGASGTIDLLSTVRGQCITLSAEGVGGVIIVRKVVEASSARLAAGHAVHALRLMSDDAEVVALGEGGEGQGGIDIGALYASRATLRVKAGSGGGGQAIAVGNLHGHAEVAFDGDSVGRSTSGSRSDVDIAGITGSVILSHIGAGAVRLQFDSARGLSRLLCGGALLLQLALPLAPLRLSLVSSLAGGVTLPAPRENLRLSEPSALAGTAVWSGVVSADAGGSSEVAGAGLSARASGKIRDGAAISGFYSSPGAQTEVSEPPTINVVAGGPIAVELVSFLELARRRVASNSNLA